MLSKTAAYPSHAVTFLASGENEVFSAEVIAERTNVSRPRPRGGYGLDVSVKVLTIFNVVNAVVPIERIRYCSLGLVAHTSFIPLALRIVGIDETHYAVTRSN